MATAFRKVDNASLAVKLALRRRILTRWHTAPLRVLDCCAGAGTIWRILRQEYPVAEYFPADIQKRPGALQVDSIRILAMGLGAFDVVDIDTYGEPFNHLAALFPQVRSPVSVFVTSGRIPRTPAAGAAALAGVNIPGIPPTLLMRLESVIQIQAFGAAYRHGLRYDDSMMARPPRGTSVGTRYYGFRLRRQED